MNEADPFPYRERTRREIVATISNYERRDGRRRRRLLIGASVALIALAGVSLGVIAIGRDSDDSLSPATALPTRLAPGPLPAADASLGRNVVFSPESFDQITPAEAENRTSFAVLFPTAPFANPSNLLGIQDGLTTRGTGEHTRPIDVVQMEFPPPTDSSSTVRQPYILVWQRVFDGSGLISVSEELKRPDGSAKACQVADHPAVCVQPRSSTDAEHANPAYLRFQRNGLVVQISGGDSLPALVDVAKSLAPISEAFAAGGS